MGPPHTPRRLGPRMCPWRPRKSPVPADPAQGPARLAGWGGQAGSSASLSSAPSRALAAASNWAHHRLFSRWLPTKHAPSAAPWLGHVCCWEGRAPQSRIREKPSLAWGGAAEGTVAVCLAELGAEGQSGEMGSEGALILHTRPLESLTGVPSRCRKARKETWPHIKGQGVAMTGTDWE